MPISKGKGARGQKGRRNGEGSCEPASVKSSERCLYYCQRHRLKVGESPILQRKSTMIVLGTITIKQSNGVLEGSNQQLYRYSY